MRQRDRGAFLLVPLFGRTSFTPSSGTVPIIELDSPYKSNLLGQLPHCLVKYMYI